MSLRPRRGGGWDEARWGRLRRPRPHPASAFSLLPGRRKRPHSTQLRPAPTDTIHPFPQVPARVNTAPVPSDNPILLMSFPRSFCTFEQRLTIRGELL